MRDDVWDLPLPDAAKRYARRKGLKSMLRQPKDFLRVNAMITNPGKKSKEFKNYDVVGKVKNTFENKSGTGGKGNASNTAPVKKAFNAKKQKGAGNPGATAAPKMENRGQQVKALASKMVETLLAPPAEGE